MSASATSLRWRWWCVTCHREGYVEEPLPIPPGPCAAVMGGHRAHEAGSPGCDGHVNFKLAA